MAANNDSLPLVLVVDDEVAIREAVRDILELAGVEAVLAANGHEALEAFNRFAHRVRLVILDLRMPVMSGLDTYHHLRKLNATVPIVLSSGYDEKIAELDFAHDPQLSMLRKPYALDDLLDTVRSVIAY